ncbi:MAG: response regulator, partial [Hyphomicrobiales bacterium]
MSASRNDHVRVLIIDDSLVARSILSRLLDDAADIEVVAAVGDIEQAAAILSGTQVDVVTLDLEMPGSDGL